MTISVTVTGVLNKLEEDEIENAVADIKKKHAASRKQRAVEVEVVIKALEKVFGNKATLREIFNAQATAFNARLDFARQGDGDILTLVIRGGIAGFISGAAQAANAQLSDETVEKIMNERLSDLAKASVERGATIREIFMIQPNLFV